jgi:hypothetical protein
MINDIESSLLPLQPNCTSLPREIETVMPKKKAENE